MTPAQKERLIAFWTIGLYTATLVMAMGLAYLETIS